MLLPQSLVAAADAASAPYTTATQGAGLTTVHQPVPVVNKQVYLGKTSYVPLHPDLFISVQVKSHNKQMFKNKRLVKSENNDQFINF